MEKKLGSMAIYNLSLTRSFRNATESRLLRPFPNTFPFLHPAPTSYKLNDKPRGDMDYKLTL